MGTITSDLLRSRFKRIKCGGFVASRELLEVKTQPCGVEKETQGA